LGLGRWRGGPGAEGEGEDGVPEAVGVSAAGGVAAVVGMAVEHAACGGAYADADVGLAEASGVEIQGRRHRRRLPEARRWDDRGAAEGVLERGRCQICPVGREHAHRAVHGGSQTCFGRFHPSISWEGVRRIAGDMIQGVGKPGICQARPVLPADDVRQVAHVLLSRNLLPAVLEEAVREGV
jgi:hypothetical protein